MAQSPHPEPPPLPDSIWGLNQIGKQPGNEVALFKLGHATIYRIVSYDQIKDIAHGISKIEPRRSFHAQPILTQSVQWLLTKVGGIDTALIKFSPTNTQISKVYLSSECDQMTICRANTAIRAFLFHWIGLELADESIQVHYRLNLPRVMPWGMEDMLRKTHLPWPREPERVSRWPKGSDIRLYVDLVWRGANQGTQCHELMHVPEENETHGLPAGMFVFRPSLNAYVHVLVDCTAKGNARWQAWQNQKGPFPGDEPKIPLQRRQDHPGTIPWSLTMVDALIQSGYVLPERKYPEWLGYIPPGNPMADLEFFKIFDKPLPPLAPLEEFVPWAAKEGLLSWSPLE
jgi:hypothetical protein